MHSIQIVILVLCASICAADLSQRMSDYFDSFCLLSANKHLRTRRANKKVCEQSEIRSII